MKQSITIILAICVMALMVHCRHVQSNHLYWFEKDHPKLNNNDDKNWYYCDQKCLALEGRFKDKDFVVVRFHETLKEPFSACYLKSGDQYLLWNKIVTNVFFQKYCGNDYKDWYNLGFNVKGIYGVGLGTDLIKHLQ